MKTLDMKRLSILLCVLMIAVFIAVYAAETWIAVSDKRTEHPSESDEFELGEVMGATQMHHSKLWFAGEAKNWGLAIYELEEMQEAFDDAVKFHPVFRKVDLASDLIDKYTVEPLSEIRRAVEAKDSADFIKSYDRLTKACNACHRETKHDFIVIQRPTTLQYSNQDFLVKTQ